MGALQPIHILLILAVVVLLFGGSKIPQLMRGIGQGTGEFKKGLEESKSDATPPPAVAVTTAPAVPTPPVETQK